MGERLDEEDGQAGNGTVSAGSPMALRILDGLSDRNPRSLPPSARRMEAGSHLAKLVGRTRSGNIRLDRGLAAMLRVDTWSADPGRTGFELRSVAAPEDVLAGIDRHLEERGIQPDFVDPGQATEVVVDIRRTLAEEGGPLSVPH